MYSPDVADEFITVAQLRAEMAKILARLGRECGHIYLIQRGRPRAVLVDVEEYRALMEQLEHLDDSIEALLAQQRGAETARPLEDVIRDRMDREAKRVKRRPKPHRRAHVSR
jgi:prevent-host-death family protein